MRALQIVGNTSSARAKFCGGTAKPRWLKLGTETAEPARAIDRTNTDGPRKPDDTTDSGNTKPARDSPKVATGDPRRA